MDCDAQTYELYVGSENISRWVGENYDALNAQCTRRIPGDLVEAQILLAEEMIVAVRAGRPTGFATLAKYSEGKESSRRKRPYFVTLVCTEGCLMNLMVQVESYARGQGMSYILAEGFRENLSLYGLAGFSLWNARTNRPDGRVNESFRLLMENRNVKDGRERQRQLQKQLPIIMRNKEVYTSANKTFLLGKDIRENKIPFTGSRNGVTSASMLTRYATEGPVSVPEPAATMPQTAAIAGERTIEDYYAAGLKRLPRKPTKDELVEWHFTLIALQNNLDPATVLAQIGIKRAKGVSRIPRPR